MDWRNFECVDLFHNNVLKGKICLSPSDYGSLKIEQVNEEKCNQYIKGTPKIKYPFDRNFKFKISPKDPVPVYEKLDGTNILAYRYKYKDKFFVTYKTRLRPVLRSGRFGNFYSWWKEMLTKFPHIQDIVLSSGLSLSFELYGSINKHLILYPIKLGIKLLFAIDGTEIITPENLQDLKLPLPTLLGELNPTTIEKDYWALAQTLEDRNKVVEEGILGCEGGVLFTEGHMYKLKPKSVFDIHAKSCGLTKKSVLLTCYNSLENSDDLDLDFVISLLREEYSDETINKNLDMITVCINTVKEEVSFRTRVIEEYYNLGLSLKSNKREVMSHFSKLYDKSLMRKIFFILNTLEQEVGCG